MSAIPYSVANYVLEDIGPPPGLNLSEIKTKLQYELHNAKQKVNYLENELNKINELMVAEQRVHELKRQLCIPSNETILENKIKKKRYKICYQKNKGKPCKLLDNGKCKYCV
jgi:hypothetical protein